MKYKHLHTWDTMMGSYDYWKEFTQALAEHDNAPLDCIYKRSEDKGGDWECASSLTTTHRFWDTHRAIHGVTEGEVHCLKCDHVWNEQDSPDACPHCGNTNKEQTVYLTTPQGETNGT